MAVCVSPSEARLILQRLSTDMRKSRFKFAAIQNGTAMSDGASLRAWRAGDRQQSIQEMFASEHLAGMQQFLRETVEKAAAGVTMIRVHLFDEQVHAEDVDSRHYLDWLKEHFRQVNVRWGKEDIHWLPKSVCDAAGIEVPTEDFGLYDDGANLFTTQCDPTGQITSRTFFTPPEDITAISKAKAIANSLIPLIATNTYKLTAPALPAQVAANPDRVAAFPMHLAHSASDQETR